MMSWECRRHCSDPCKASLSPCFGVQTESSKTLRLLKELCPGRLLIRQSGLTLIQQTNLLAEGEGQKDFIQFESALINSLRVILFQCPSTNCLRAAFLNRKDQIVSHLMIDSLPWISDGAYELRSKLSLHRVNSHHCYSHCQRWLDDWSGESLARRNKSNLEVTKDLLPSCESLRISIKRDEFHLESELHPSFIDNDDNIIRITDHRQDHVVYADLNLIDYRFEQNAFLITG